LMSFVSFFTPIFIQFTERDRDLTRLTGAATSIWLIIAIPYLWYTLKNGSKTIRLILGVAYVTVIFSGLALFPTQLVAIASPQPSYYIQEPDVLISQEYWDRLEPDAKILDLNFIYRPSVLFGRSTAKAYETVYIPFPEFLSLVKNPDPVNISKAGYRYIYLDRHTWKKMDRVDRTSFQDQCVQLIAEKKASNGDFRRLLDIQSCQSQD
jgi:hypothetical protein